MKIAFTPALAASFRLFLAAHERVKDYIKYVAEDNIHKEEGTFRRISSLRDFDGDYVDLEVEGWLDGEEREDIMIGWMRSTDEFKAIDVHDLLDQPIAEEFMAVLSDYVCEQIKIETDKRRDAENLKRLNAAAVAFAEKCGHAVGSMEFIHAAYTARREDEEEVNEKTSGECFMERSARASACGQSMEDFYSDEDDIREELFRRKLRPIYDVIDWLEKNCPLTMMAYREKYPNPESKPSN
jgi:hypothetical protein